MKDKILSQSPQTMLILGVLIAVVAYFANPTKSPYDAKIKTIGQELSTAKEKLTQTMERAQNKAKFQEEMVQLSDTVRKALEYLPKELDIQDLLKKIYSESRNAGVQLSLIKPKDSVSKDFYDELPIEITLYGSYSQIVLFLSYISKLPRIVNIKNIEIGDAKIVDGSPIMKLGGTLLTYRYKEGK